MFKKNPIALLCLVTVVILFATLIINSLIEKNMAPTAVSQSAIPVLKEKEPKATGAQQPVTHELIAEKDPAKYGIIIQDAAEVPRTPAQWDRFMTEAIIKNKVLEQPGAQPAVEVMKKSPEDFEARQKEIDDRIALFEKKTQENPSDADAEHHLQTLYMLKALGKVLKNKVTEPPLNLPSP